MAQERDRAELLIDRNEAAVLADAIENEAIAAGPVRPGRGFVAGLAGALIATAAWGLVSAEAGQPFPLAMVGVGWATGFAARRFGGAGRPVQRGSVLATITGIVIGWQAVACAVLGRWVSPVAVLWGLGVRLTGIDFLFLAFALYLAWKLPSR